MDKLTAINKIILATGNINYACGNLQTVYSEKLLVSALRKDNNILEGANEIETVLQEVSEKLQQILEDVCDYMNNHDITTEEDAFVMDNVLAALRNEHVEQ